MSNQTTSIYRKLFDNFEEVMSVVCVGVMVACLMLQVGMRWTTGSGVAWTEELSRYSFLWTVFFAAILVAKHGAEGLLETEMPSSFAKLLTSSFDKSFSASGLAIPSSLKALIPGLYVP